MTHDFKRSNGSSPGTVKSLRITVRKEQRKAMVRSRELHRMVRIHREECGVGARTGEDRLTNEKKNVY